MKVIVLAGGKGTRLPQSAKNIPKPLVKVGSKTMLQHQLDLLKKHGFFDIRLSLGYKANQIIKYLDGKPHINSSEIIRGKYEYIIEPEPLGTGGAIKFASKDLEEEFMVLNGDILSEMNFTDFLKFHKNIPQHNTLTAWHCPKPRDDYGFLNLKNNKILEFQEKPSRPTIGYINAGFYILSPDIFNNVNKKSFSIEKDIFPKLAKKGDLAAFVFEGYWTDAGTEERLKEAQERFKNL